MVGWWAQTAQSAPTGLGRQVDEDAGRALERIVGDVGFLGGKILGLEGIALAVHQLDPVEGFRFPCPNHVQVAQLQAGKGRRGAAKLDESSSFHDLLLQRSDKKRGAEAPACSV